jgi:hypothetical protein
MACFVAKRPGFRANWVNPTFAVGGYHLRAMITDSHFEPGFLGHPTRLASRELFDAIEGERRMLRARREGFYRQLRAERRAQSLRQLFSFWPLAVGLILGACAPGLWALINDRAPWALTAVFPFVALAGRPEIAVGRIAQAFPMLMLYAQFPLEGLFVRMILKRGVTVPCVFGEVSGFHILALLQLWLLSGALQQYTR